MEEINIPKIKELESYSYGDKLTMMIQGGYAPKEDEFDQTDTAQRLEKLQHTIETEFANMIAVLDSIKTVLDYINGKMSTTNTELQSIKSDTGSIDSKITTPTA